jgi:phage replication initiation protein
MSQILPGAISEGRTLYVGKRGNDVMLRCYEKGKKEFADLPSFAKAAGSAVTINDDEGKPVSLLKWMRLELELRSASRPLPLDVIADRDQYFAGAYPFLQSVLPDVEPEILVRPERIAEASLARKLQHIREQYGSTLFTALTVYQGDVCEVFKRIVGNQHNDDLLKSGVLLMADLMALED